MRAWTTAWLCLCTGLLAAAAAPRPVKIAFEPPVAVTGGNYGRVHPLGGGRFALVYEGGGGVQFRTSADRCRTWSAPTRVVAGYEAGEGDRRTFLFPANPEVCRLASGRLLAAFNWRPAKGRADRQPYSIGIAISDDGGTTWSKARTVYAATNVVDGVMRGCYEPFIHENGGKVRIYFSDESPYVAGTHKYQNISYVESEDRGRSWSRPKIYCHTPQARDGMPVAEQIGRHLYVAIETNGNGTRLHPELVRDDGVRLEPLLDGKDWHRVYAGAPYLAATANFVLLSYQSSEGGAASDHRRSSCEVVAMPRGEVRDGKLTAFRGAARPLAVDQTREAALWNALCPLGGDDFVAVSGYRGQIWLTRGHVGLERANDSSGTKRRKP